MHSRFKNYLNQSVYSASLFPADTLMGLLTIAEPAIANAVKDIPNNHPHDLLYKTAPFNAAMSCGSNTIPTPGLSQLHIQAGINRPPIVTTKTHGSLAFNYDLTTLGHVEMTNLFTLL